jgi:uncharacterized membrane protein YdbT with pleckstrin-like domain
MEDIQQQLYYHLGRKTFWILVVQRIGLALLFFIISLIVIGLKGLLVGNNFVIGLQEFFVSNNIIVDFGSIISWVFIAFILLGILTLAIGIIIGFLQYNTSRVMFDNTSFHIVRGILNKEEFAIPYRRIQSVEIKQSLIYRIVGVGHLVISTTTDLEEPNQTENETDEEVIPTIDYPLAKMVEKTLTDRAEIERVEIKQN